MIKKTRERKGDGSPKEVKVSAPPIDAAALERTQIAKYHTKGGHGFAAEDANTIADRLSGKDAKVIGKSNELGGPDRVVDGIFVQSKYYKNASSTINAAFKPNGGPYLYSDQALEVPKEQYARCVELMRERISEGRVPGHKNPADAEKIIKKGRFTYGQARDVARPGNMESLKLDLKTGASYASGMFGASFAVNYWRERRDGKDGTDAIKAAFQPALRDGSVALVSHVISAQLLRTKMAAKGTVAARQVMHPIARTRIGKSVVEGVATASLGKRVSEAAARNHVSKLLRSNVITSSVTAAVMCVPDFYRAAVDNSISWQQFTKNAVVNVANVAGGAGGAVAGAAAGATLGSAVPIVGTVLGGMLGGLVGGMAADLMARTIIGEIIQDADDWCRHEEIQRQCKEAIREICANATQLERIQQEHAVEEERLLGSAFDKLRTNYGVEDVDGFLNGLCEIAAACGGDLPWSDFETFNAWMEDDNTTLKL